MSWKSLVTWAALAGAASTPTVPAQWETIVPGIEYRRFDLAGPVQVFVARLDHAQFATRGVDSMIAQGQFYKVGLPSGGRETVSAMAARYDGQINFYSQTWGQRNDVVVAINGDYWERETYPSGPFTGRPESGQVQGGWFCRRFDEFSGGSGFFWYIFGGPNLGGDVVNGGSAARQTVHFQDNSTANLTGVNVERGSGDLILYTPQWDGTTHTDASGVEVLVQVDRPALPLPYGTSAFSCTGTILAVRDGLGNTPIPFDCVVLSGTGSNATALRNRCTAGETLRLRMIVRDYGFDSRTPPLPPEDWTKAYGAVGVDREIVVAGTATNLANPEWPRDPRTAVCHSATHTHFVVVDGRRPGSIGMNSAELASFMITQLGAAAGATLDGGGSSAMWIQGRGIVNVPSDGSERATTNGLMMFAAEPREQSTLFQTSDPVVTSAATVMRLGPGTNFDVLANVPAGAPGAITAHGLNGVQATGTHWWRWAWNGVEGWTPEGALLEPLAAQGWVYR